MAWHLFILPRVGGSRDASDLRRTIMQNYRPLMFVASCFAALTVAMTARADTVTVTMYLATDNGPGKEMGTIEFEDTPLGMKITPRLMRLREGLHPIHVNELPSCAAKEKNGEIVPALGAGDTLKSDKPGNRGTLEGKRHFGDLPDMYAHYDGAAYHQTLAPHMKTSDLLGRSIVIDALGPAYRDAPKPRGGAPLRVACGVVLP